MAQEGRSSVSGGKAAEPEPARAVADWSAEEVGAWLEMIGLGVHKHAFISNEVDGRLLLKLTVQEIQEELGIKSGLQAKRVVSKIEVLALSQSASTQASASGAATGAQQGEDGAGAGGVAGMQVKAETREVFYVSDQSLWSKKFTCE